MSVIDRHVAHDGIVTVLLELERIHLKLLIMFLDIMLYFPRGCMCQLVTVWKREDVFFSTL